MNYLIRIPDGVREMWNETLIPMTKEPFTVEQRQKLVRTLVRAYMIKNHGYCIITGFAEFGEGDRPVLEMLANSVRQQVDGRLDSIPNRPGFWIRYRIATDEDIFQLIGAMDIKELREETQLLIDNLKR